MPSRPLFFGRLLRVLLGSILCGWLVVHPPEGLLLQGVVLFLGISLIIGGIKAYAGCEILAIPNLLLGRSMHCY